MLNNFKIKSKLYLLATIGLLNLVVLFSVVQWMAGKEAKVNKALQLNNHLKIEILTLRKHEKDFFARNDLKYVTKFKKTNQEFVTQYFELKALLSEFGIVNQDVTQLKSHFLHYEEVFHQVVAKKQFLGLNEKMGIQGQLRNSVHEVESLIKEAGAIQLTADMLMLRRREKDFLLRQNPKYIKKFNKDFIVFTKHLENSNLSDQQKAEIETFMESYKADFLTLAKEMKILGLGPKLGLHGELRNAIHKASKLQHKVMKQIDTFVIQQHATYQRDLVGITFILGLFVLIVIISLVRSIVQPIIAVTKSLEDLVHGDANLNNAIPIRSNDEIGKLSELFNQFLGNLRHLIETILGNAQSMNSIITNVDNENNSLIESRKLMTQISASNASAIQELNINARTVAANAEQASSNMKQVADSTNELTNKLNTIAGAAEEASTNIALVSENSTKVAAQVNDLALPSTTELVSALSEVHKQTGLAEKIVVSGVESAKKNKASMTKLNQVATSISQIIKMISTIASQTNMLALNATIEAASAGQSGKGFAVVAHEVKKLSNETNQASNDVAEQINQIQTLVNDGFQEAQEVADVMGKISAINTEIADSVDHQTKKSEELFSTIESIGSATTSSAAMTIEASIGMKEITTAVATISQDGKISEKNTREAAAGVSEIARAISEISTGTDGIHQNNNTSNKSIENNSAILDRIFSYFQTLSHLSNDQNQAVSKIAKGGETLFYEAEQLFTGIPEIDDKHHKIIDEVNSLFQSLKSDNQKLKQTHASSLIKEVRLHFKEEEKLFFLTDYPEKEEHKTQHSELLTQLEDLVYKDSGSSLDESSINLVKDLLQTHFLVTDKNYISYLKETTQPS